MSRNGVEVTVGSLLTAAECDREPFCEMKLEGFHSDVGMTELLSAEICYTLFIKGELQSKQVKHC